MAACTRWLENVRCSPLNGRAVLGASKYGNATEGYWLSNVHCTGSESDVTDCPRSEWGDEGACDVTEPAGVSCLSDAPATPPRRLLRHSLITYRLCLQQIQNLINFSFKIH